MEIKDKKVRTLIEEEYLIDISGKSYRYIDFSQEGGKFTSWSMIEADTHENIVADDPEIIQIVARVQNTVDRYNNKTPRHTETHNEQTNENDESSRDTGADQDND